MIRGTYVAFENRRPTESGKTFIWDVVAFDGYLKLGEVRWYAPWRCYAFMPQANTLFEKVCLREIAAFIEDAQDRWRKGKISGGER